MMVNVMRRVMGMLVVAAALVAAGAAHAEGRCASRSAVGGGLIATCREVGGVAAEQFRTWDRVCRTRAAAGWGPVTVCREGRRWRRCSDFSATCAALVRFWSGSAIARWPAY
jgi:hypothetical protein